MKARWKLKLAMWYVKNRRTVRVVAAVAVVAAAVYVVLLR